MNKNNSIKAIQSGFTLIELLIAMAITSIVTTAIYTAYLSQQKSYSIQDQVVEIQQNLRASLDLMIRDIRMAGYNPDDTLNAGMTAISNTAITFSMDDESGGLDTIVYSHDTTNRTLSRNFNASGAQPVAENIEALSFAYAYDVDNDGIPESYTDTSGKSRVVWAADTDGDGDWDNLDTDGNGVINEADSPNPGTSNTELIVGTDTGTSVNPDQIRAVRIWLLARTAKTDRNFTNSVSYIVGNQKKTFNDGFRRRLLTTTVRCRNLGLN